MIFSGPFFSASHVFDRKAGIQYAHTIEDFFGVLYHVLPRGLKFRFSSDVFLSR